MRISYCVLGLLFLSTLLVGCSEETVQINGGEPVPAFSLQKLDGGTAQFPNDYKNKVVAIRFWADWCPFCESEMRQLEPVYQKYKDQGVEILAINVRQDQATAKAFVEPLNISYPTLLDLEGEVARQYGVMGLPTTFFVDGKGVLKTRILGESTPEAFEDVIQSLLKASGN